MQWSAVYLMIFKDVYIINVYLYPSITVNLFALFTLLAIFNLYTRRVSTLLCFYKNPQKCRRL
jgi:hypothetical protein